MAQIELPEDVAAVVLDLVRSMLGPQEPERVAYSFREARYLAPLLEQAFQTAGVEPGLVERPTIPLLKLGSKAT